MLNKDAIQNFKIPAVDKKEFNQLCKENLTTPSIVLRDFYYKKIKEFKKNGAKK